MNISEIFSHYESVWGMRGRRLEFPRSSMSKLPIDFCILEFSPQPTRNMWTYATCGMSLGGSKKIELHLFSNTKLTDIGEILAACADYHLNGAPLWVGDSVNFGRPWANSSICDFGLISLPYLDGPDLEKMKAASGEDVSFFWLIPITKAEVEYKKKYGLDSLETLFEDRNFQYNDPLRESVC